jgi:DNA-binding SARP family transcriptional activator
MAILRRLANEDAFLSRTLAYVDGSGGLDFGSHTRFRAFAIMLRAERETEYTERMHLLRSAIAHADDSLEVEMRFATRLAYAYASPHDASQILDEAAVFARNLRSDAFAQALINAERLVVAGVFAGIARRFISTNDQPRVRLGILDGTIAGRSGEPIAIAQRQFELMVFLALHENGAADRDSIIDAIWPDLDPTAGAHALKTAAHRIRTALGDAGAVLLTPTGYRLPETVETDVERLEALLGSMMMEDAPARLGGLPNAYRTFAVGVEQLRDRLSRWSWADRYLPRLESLLHRLGQAIANRANVLHRTEYSHRIVADLRTLDDEDETAFGIAISAHLAEGNRLSARREYVRYAAVLAAYGEKPPESMDRSVQESA